MDVGERRTDGYHDIDSVVQVIDLSDLLTVTVAPAGVIDVVVEDGDAPVGRNNLIYKACEAFLRATNLSAGARFGLTKRVPTQAGLGGGSSNAAAALVALDRLFGTGLSTAELSSIAAEVGSDAALFVYGGTVRMRGRGDIVDPLPDAPELKMVIIKPNVGVSTSWAYAEFDRIGKRDSFSASDHAERAIRHGDRDSLIESLSNDFDPVVSESFGEIKEAKDILVRLGARRAMLCGSGSAVFGVFDSSDVAESAAECARLQFSQVFVTRSKPRGETGGVAFLR